MSASRLLPMLPSHVVLRSITLACLLLAALLPLAGQVGRIVAQDAAPRVDVIHDRRHDHAGDGAATSSGPSTQAEDDGARRAGHRDGHAGRAQLGDGRHHPRHPRERGAGRRLRHAPRGPGRLGRGLHHLRRPRRGDGARHQHRLGLARLPGGGEDDCDDTMTKKVTNDAVAQIRQPGQPARPQRRLGRAGRPRGGQHHRRRGRSTSTSSTSSRPT